MRSESKILVSLRRLGTGRSYDDLDDCTQMGVETIRQTCKRFTKAMIRHYSPGYLNSRPNKQELGCIEEAYAAENFPGCVGAVDCCKLI